MGIAAVIFSLLVGWAILAILWRSELRLRLGAESLLKVTNAKLVILNDECKALEAEIQRLQKSSLVEKPKAVDNSVVVARSAAEVRNLTEKAWGLREDK